MATGTAHRVDRDRALERIERARRLDPPGDRLQRVLSGVLRPGRLRDLLQGVWLGHPLHPVLVQAPVGAWMSAAVLDAVPGQETAATTLVAAGTVAAVPAAMAGAADWTSLNPAQRRVGLLHAAANSVALGLFAGSVVARLRGRTGTGRVLSYTALGIAGASAYLGGHLSYGMGAGMNRAAADLDHVPDGWQDLGAAADVPTGRPVVRHVGDVPVLVHRGHDGTCSALLARCGHRSGPLGDGERVDVDGQPCVRCPWHGSVFRLRDGAVVRGPAASDQPTLEVRVRDGRLEVRT